MGPATKQRRRQNRPHLDANGPDTGQGLPPIPSSKQHIADAVYWHATPNAGPGHPALPPPTGLRAPALLPTPCFPAVLLVAQMAATQPGQAHMTLPTLPLERTPVPLHFMTKPSPGCPTILPMRGLLTTRPASSSRALP